MIKNRRDLREYIAADNPWFIEKTLKEKIVNRIVAEPYVIIGRYLRYLRKAEYYKNTSRNSVIKKILYLFFVGRKNVLGNRLGIEIGCNCFEKGLSIWHVGSIIVNPSVKVGCGCVLRGSNCIGNNGTIDTNPVLGDHVELGYGATIIGNIYIGNNTIIGANAVVNKSVEGNCTLVGIPAHRLE